MNTSTTKKQTKKIFKRTYHDRRDKGNFQIAHKCHLYDKLHHSKDVKERDHNHVTKVVVVNKESLFQIFD